MNQLQSYHQSSTIQLHKSILNDEQNVVKLIRLFRGQECLWNSNCDNYRNLALKENIWQTIADQFGSHVTSDQVKRKVKGLRNCFSTERNRVQKSMLDGRGEIYAPTLYYYKEFEFLQGITKRMSKEFGNIKADFSDDYDDKNSPCDESMFNMSYSNNNNDFSTNDTTSTPHEDMKLFEPIVLNKTEFNPPNKKFRTRSSHSSVKSMELKHDDDQKEQTIHPNASQVQSLCEMIKVDLKDVSEELFFDAKWKIMDILREVHRKHLEDKRKVIKRHEHATSSRSPTESADTSTMVLTKDHHYLQP